MFAYCTDSYDVVIYSVLTVSLPLI